MIKKFIRVTKKTLLALLGFALLCLFWLGPMVLMTEFISEAAGIATLGIQTVLISYWFFWTEDNG